MFNFSKKNNSRLALTVDGRMTVCTAKHVGNGNCNHLLHQNPNESDHDFQERVDREINQNFLFDTNFAISKQFKSKMAEYTEEIRKITNKFILDNKLNENHLEDYENEIYDLEHDYDRPTELEEYEKDDVYAKYADKIEKEELAEKLIDSFKQMRKSINNFKSETDEDFIIERNKIAKEFDDFVLKLNYLANKCAVDPFQDIPRNSLQKLNNLLWTENLEQAKILIRQEGINK